MPINGTGQGEGPNTPVKQEALRSFMDVHAGIVKRIQMKWKDRIVHDYYYIDTNAGTGRNGDGTEGSLLIARRFVLQQKLVFHGFAIENNPVAWPHLEANVPPQPYIEILRGDNAELLRSSLLPPQLSPQKWLFGMVYCDPNLSHELPFEALCQFFAVGTPSTQHLDLLIHLSATMLKRCRETSRHRFTLPSLMAGIHKKYWYIRELYHANQWTFLFGTNWDKWPSLNLRVDGVLQDLRSLEMHSVTTPQGQAFLEKAILTNRELQKKTQSRLFPTELMENT